MTDRRVSGFTSQDAQGILQDHKSRQVGRRPPRIVPQDPRIPLVFVKVPDDGFAAATDDGATPSVTTCVVYRQTGTNGALEKALSSNGEDLTYEVLHYGAASPSAASRDFKYAGVMPTIAGWVLTLDYCDS